MTITVNCCARCGGVHALDFEKFVNAVKGEAGSPDFTHWAMCPSMREPILLRIITTQDVK